MRLKIKPVTGLLFTHIVAVLVMVLSINTLAQSINGSISGVVTDQTGAIIAGAVVKVTNVGTSAVRESVANEQGAYRISGLPIGTYNIRVEKSGFQPKVVEKISVSVAVDASVKFSLGTESVQEVVTITDSGATLDTTQSQVVKTVDNQKIMELPGRNTLNGLALLNPGVLPSQNGRPGSGFAVNGNRTRSNNFTIDGANNNDQSLSTPRQGLPPEAIQEFQMITNSFSAEYGRNAGSYVNVITKSGTNQFHGIGHWTWQGNGYDALTTNQERTYNGALAKGLSEKDALRSARGVTVDNVFGGVFSGPIKKDHTFFFFSADFNPVRQTANPTGIGISQDGMNKLKANAAAYGLSSDAISFLEKTYPIANVPASRGNLSVKHKDTKDCKDVGAQCLTIPLATYNRSLGEGRTFAYGTNFQRYITKISTKINDKDQLSFRYIFDDFDDPGSPTHIVNNEIGQKTRNQSFTINDVYAINERIINESRITYSRRKLRFPENLPTAFNITGLPAIGNTSYPQQRTDNSYEITDNLSYTANKHNWKFGANALRYDLNSFFAPLYDGNISYSSLTNFLYDTNATVQRYAGEANIPAKTYEVGFFAQDDWRVNSDLTLNLGVRYEYVTTPFGFFSNAKSDLNNIAPAIGFAWNPKGFQSGKFVLRGGYRTSFDQVFQNVLLNAARNFPRGVSVSEVVSGKKAYASPIPIYQPSEYQAKTGNNPNLLPVRLFSPNKRYEQPMSMQYSLGVQYQLAKDYVIKLDYIGTKGTHLVREVESNFGFVNKVTPDGGTISNGQRLDPTKGSVLIADGIANSIYHAGQVTLEKRFSSSAFGALNFNANYTYSSFISESDDILGGQVNRTLPADPRNARLDRARSGFDMPHRFVVSYLYELPKLVNGLSGASGRVVDGIANGWELTGVTTIATGTPYTIFSANNQLGILPGQIATVHLSQRVGFNPSGTGQLVGLPGSNARYIVYPENSGKLGNLGANTERTGGIKRFDIAVVKKIKASESHRIDFRWELFNVFNHRNFTVIPTNTAPGDGTNSEQFLNLGYTNVSGRSMLFSLRYQF